MSKYAAYNLFSCSTNLGFLISSHDKLDFLIMSLSNMGGKQHRKPYLLRVLGYPKTDISFIIKESFVNCPEFLCTTTYIPH